MGQAVLEWRHLISDLLAVSRFDHAWRQPTFAHSCGPFHKHYMCVNYGPGKISCTVHSVRAPMQGFLNELAYFAIAVCYGAKGGGVVVVIIINGKMYKG
jgi:hypothetical protein